MITKKQTATSASRPAPATIPAAEPATTGRKPWKKRSVAENILSQLDKLREEVADKERDLTHTKKQLEQLEALRKVLETT